MRPFLKIQFSQKHFYAASRSHVLSIKTFDSRTDRHTFAAGWGDEQVSKQARKHGAEVLFIFGGDLNRIEVGNWEGVRERVKELAS